MYRLSFMSRVGICSAILLLIGILLFPVFDQLDVIETRRVVQRILKYTMKYIERRGKDVKKAITEFGCRKISAINNIVIPFIKSIKMLHNFELSNLTNDKKLQCFRIDKCFFEELERIEALAAHFNHSEANVAAMLGSYGFSAITDDCVTADVTIPVSTLSGTLLLKDNPVFVSRSTESIYDASNTTANNNLIVSYAMSAMKFFSECPKSSSNRYNANTDLVNAKEFCVERRAVKAALNSIKMTANRLERLLIKLDAVSAPLQYKLDKLICYCGTDYSAYSDEQKDLIFSVLAVVNTVVLLIDTPLLTKDGRLAEESAVITDTVTNTLSLIDNKIR